MLPNAAQKLILTDISVSREACFRSLEVPQALEPWILFHDRCYPVELSILLGYRLDDRFQAHPETAVWASLRRKHASLYLCSLPGVQQLVWLGDEHVRRLVFNRLQARRARQLLDAGDRRLHAVNDGSFPEPSTFYVLQAGCHAPSHSPWRVTSRTVVGAHKTRNYEQTSLSETKKYTL